MQNVYLCMSHIPYWTCSIFWRNISSISTFRIHLHQIKSYPPHKQQTLNFKLGKAATKIGGKQILPHNDTNMSTIYASCISKIRLNKIDLKTGPSQNYFRPATFWQFSLHLPFDLNCKELVLNPTHVHPVWYFHPKSSNMGLFAKRITLFHSIYFWAVKLCQKLMQSSSRE